MVATAIIMAVAFGAIYLIVQQTVLNNFDSDLSYEANKHTKEIKLIGDSIVFKNKTEWEEKEHREIQVNPVFLQLIDKHGRLMDKSPNLKENSLLFHSSEYEVHFTVLLNNRVIRQAQIPIKENGIIQGYILAAMSFESAQSIILKLRNVLLISFLVILAGLYFISRFLAGRSIKPIQNVTKTIDHITKLNLAERVELPTNLDEIYELASGFNALLDRIENAMEREKQFTSDASHELRTPLASLRGTLEVLIRKPRSQEEYQEKIQFSLSEIERMSNLLDQLLLLARLDANESLVKRDFISLPSVVNEALTAVQSKIREKNLKVDFQFEASQRFLVPSYYTNLIINNIISNSVKYANDNSTIKISVEMDAGQVKCSISDEGIGINESDLKLIYQQFFRSESLNHKHISGNGLGLSIAKKSADAIGASLEIQSKIQVGTTVIIIFKL